MERLDYVVKAREQGKLQEKVFCAFLGVLRATQICAHAGEAKFASSLLILLERPISGAISAVALFFFALPIITPWWRRLRGVPVPTASPRET